MKSPAPGFTRQQVQQRLTNIVEHEVALACKKRGGRVQLNDALLEEWKQLLARMLAAPTKHHKLQEEAQVKLPLLSPVPPLADKISEDVLLRVQQNKLDVYARSELSEKMPKPRRLKFQSDIFKRFSAYCSFGAQKCLIFGGSEPNNPNLKSRDVICLDLVSGEGSVVCNIAYGVSSHSVVRVGDKVAIVGGNKNFNIPTKQCLMYDVLSQQTGYMCPLNNVSAHTRRWPGKNSIGSCFQQWGLSPYIERYSWKENSWTMINPNLLIDQSLLLHYGLFAHCLAYVSNQNSIIIMGGFDFSFNGSNKMLELSIQGSENHTYHITKLGTVDGMEPGGFLQGHPVLANNRLYTFQTIKTETKLMSLGSKVNYV